MIFEFVTEVGPWAWLLLGFVLLGLELLAPGVFLVWFGLAALVVGGVSVMPFADVGWWPWQIQAIAFVVLSALFAMVGTRLLKDEASPRETTASLNDPGARFVGRTAELVSPIADGIGRIRLGDTTWRVMGPDLPQGAKVRIVGTRSETLVVEAA